MSLGLAACTTDTGAEPEDVPTTTTGDIAPTLTVHEEPVTVGMYGSREELDAYRAVVESFNGSGTHEAELVAWRNHDAAMRDILDGGDVPDVFMASRSDLRGLLDRDLLQPVSLLMDERGLDLGDRFARDAVDSFAVDDNLQCMAYTTSPMVMYYNSELINWDRMRRRGFDVPSSTDKWTFEQFAAAVRHVTRRNPDVAGVHVEPSLRELAPFIYSGGGTLFDDEDEPTSLAFSDAGTREALDTTLQVLRDSTLTLSEEQLEKRTALEWFKRGRLAMMPGFRSLVPQLRLQARLKWDVIGMPQIDSTSTVGDVRGLCISAASDNISGAADFISYAVSDVAVERVVRTGSVVPANTSVAGSDVFLAPGRRPEHAAVFNNALRGMVTPPLLEDYSALERSIDPLLHEMLTRPGVLDLERMTERIDRASRPVFAEQGPQSGESGE
jgi:multiple sugar transport system substrate-binding protein